MKRKNVLNCFMAIALATGMASANASIRSDLAQGASLESAIQYAVDEGMDIEQAVLEALEAAPGLTSSVVAAAIAIAPDKADVIVRAAVENTPAQAASIQQAAIAAGAAPEDVITPPAAGAPETGSIALPTLPTLPASAQAVRVRPTAVPPANRGGGGVASPS